MKSVLLAVMISMGLMAGCTWVEPTTSGEKVRVLAADEVTKCEKLGSTTSQVLATVGGVARSEKKVAEELETLARNSAADMGGDTIVPVSEVVEGKRSFNIYRCVPR